MATIPAPTLVLDKASYVAGEPMRLKCKETITGARTWTVTDSQQVWSRDDGAGTADYTIFTSIAQHPAQDHSVTVKLTRTRDGAHASTTKRYDVTPRATQIDGVLFGVSCTDYDHQLPIFMSDGVTPSWGSGHCYNWGKARSTSAGPSKFHMKSVQISDSDHWDQYGGNSVLTNAQVSSLLDDIDSYHHDFPNIDVRYSWGNEVDRHVSNYANFIHSVSLIRSAMSSRYGSAYGSWITLWTSFTGSCFRPKGSAPPEINQFDGLGNYVYGLGVDIYPPGRDPRAGPVAPAPYADFIDPVALKMKSWNVKHYACWETGCAIPDSGPNGTYPNNGKTRAQYMKGLRDYAIAKMKDNGITTVEINYWDDNIGIDDRLSQDGDKTAKAWTDWK